MNEYLRNMPNMKHFIASLVIAALIGLVLGVFVFRSSAV